MNLAKIRKKSLQTSIAVVEEVKIVPAPASPVTDILQTVTEMPTRQTFHSDILKIQAA